MEIVKKSINIHAPWERVLGVMVDIPGYASFMPNIDAVSILSLDFEQLSMTTEITSGSSLLPGKQVSVQDIEFNFEDLSMKFIQREGPLDFFQGFRRLQPLPDGVRFCSEVHYKFKDGLLGRMAGRSIRGTVEKNVDVLLQSVKSRSEENPDDFLPVAELINTLKQTPLVV